MGQNQVSFTARAGVLFTLALSDSSSVSGCDCIVCSLRLRGVQFLQRSMTSPAPARSGDISKLYCLHSRHMLHTHITFMHCQLWVLYSNIMLLLYIFTDCNNLALHRTNCRILWKCIQRARLIMKGWLHFYLYPRPTLISKPLATLL